MRHPGPTTRHDFTRLLDARARAGGAAPDGAQGAAHLPRAARGIGNILAGTTQALPSESSAMPAQALAGSYGYERTAEAPQPDPAETDPQAIAAALGLSPELTREDLHRIRRDFALLNHPDRVSAFSREVATRRMAIANTLIDRALAAKAKPSA